MCIRNEKNIMFSLILVPLSPLSLLSSLSSLFNLIHTRTTHSRHSLRFTTPPAATTAASAAFTALPHCPVTFALGGPSASEAEEEVFTPAERRKREEGGRGKKEEEEEEEGRWKDTDRRVIRLSIGYMGSRRSLRSQCYEIHMSLYIVHYTEC